MRNSGDLNYGSARAVTMVTIILCLKVELGSKAHEVRQTGDEVVLKVFE